MNNQFKRTELVIGEQAIKRLNECTVAIFGIGGVGGYVCEALARSGISHFVLVDNDVVSESNINRQIIATYDTIGQYKTEVMKNRILSINPNATVEIHNCFFLPDNTEFEFEKYDYVVDAIDTVSAKIELVLRCQSCNTPLISSMGTGNKLDPTKLTVTDIHKTEMDPLARVMRRELKKRGVKHLKVVYSTEKPIKPSAQAKEKYIEQSNEKVTKRDIPGSTAFVPSSAGLLIASEVVKDLTINQRKENL